MLELQLALGYTALAAGASLAPITVLMILLSSRSGALAQRIGARIQMTVGPVIIAVGLLLFTRIAPGNGYVSTVLPAVIVFGLGLACTVAPLTATVLASVDDGELGVASGVNNAASRLAGPARGGGAALARPPRDQPARRRADRPCRRCAAHLCGARRDRRIDRLVHGGLGSAGQGAAARRPAAALLRPGCGRPRERGLTAGHVARHTDDMETRNIGKIDASVVGLGCNNFGGRIDEAATKLVVDAALDAGITLFDTADIYGGTRSEEFLGRALGSRRDEAVLATKFGGPIDEERKGGASAAYIAARSKTACAGWARIASTCTSCTSPTRRRRSTRRSRRSTGSCARARCSRSVPATSRPSRSTRPPRSAADRDLARFVSVQNEYSLLRRGPERFGVIDACERNGLAFIPYFPLASGVLTGKYRRHEAPPPGTRLAGMPAERVEDALSDKVFDRVEALGGFARDHGHSLGELAIAWLLARPTVASVIAGATKAEQAHANAAAAAWKLTETDLTEIDTLLDAAKNG